VAVADMAAVDVAAADMVAADMRAAGADITDRPPLCNQDVINVDEIQRCLR
jgi:hypothetical protein